MQYKNCFYSFNIHYVCGVAVAAMMLCLFQAPVSSGATLIVAPHSITHQWVDEVLRHVAVDALQIFVSSLLSCLNHLCLTLRTVLQMLE